MNEDAKLNDFLKERLEAGVSGEPPRLDAILRAASAAAQARAAARRRSVFLWGGLLAAASLAVLCLFAVHLRTSSTSPSPSASAPSQSAPMGGFCLVSFKSMAVAWGNLRKMALQMRAPTCSSRLEGMAISRFTI